MKVFGLFMPCMCRNDVSGFWREKNIERPVASEDTLNGIHFAFHPYSSPSFFLEPRFMFKAVSKE